ncbi:NAD(P)-binding protein [Tilletiaria anomala UBC 951]|uniref:NAD(P)-binding protein n=1 Tax=Tilletiaria anomala (strain ATCC 24038 / CBS 436.72 / UBC 951) TaxID=1037660 RepID=A0A066VCH0_TILAU|nr:NAD(P)-binding protein [Tilletiaria anomala UBC 951]KDN37988.1 NAD(P)-binding protein [Tilletiaria anomala UBC 951]
MDVAEMPSHQDNVTRPLEGRKERAKSSLFFVIWCSTMSSEKQVVLLTGASRGLGLAIAKILLRGSQSVPPARVVTLARSHPAELQSLEKEFPHDLVCVQGDVTEQGDNQKAVDTAKAQWGRLDSVILNSGILLFGRLGEQSAADFFQVQNVNLLSLHLTLMVALPHLRKAPSGCGKVVFVSSGAAVANSAAWGAYNVSKAGANALARTLAQEEKGDASQGRAPVAVWAVRPGAVDTEMQANLRANSAQHVDSDVHQRFIKLHEEGQLLKPEQPGHVLAALALLGTRESPADGKQAGLGAQGAFVNWNAEELLHGAWQLPA